MIHFVTYFDEHYLPFGMCLLRSLAEHQPLDRVHIVALTPECYRALNGLDLGLSVQIHTLTQIEQETNFPLTLVKPDRSPRDYYFTMQACLPAHFMNQLDLTTDDWLAYVDADLFFFDALQPTLARLPSGAHVLASPHYFPDAARHKATSAGRYNCGFVMFRGTGTAYDQAIDWGDRACHQCDPSTCWEQRYLDGWPAQLGTALYELPPTVNCGPWRLPQICGTPPLLDGERLQSFHTHELRRGAGANPVRINGQPFNLTNYPVSALTMHSVYKPYLETLEDYI